MTSAVPPTGAHGGDGPAVARALGIDVVDLSQSLNPVAPDVAAMIARHLDSLRQYPDPGEATVALARCLDVDPRRVVLTNGGAEAIHLLSGLLGGRVDEPDFSLYPRGGGPRWRSNPHSPSGRLADPQERADVWDEAFYPLATGAWTRGDGGWVVGSLTKLYACPGLRLGYVVAPDVDGAAEVRARQPAWPVGSLALAVLPDLLAVTDLRRWRDEVAVRRARLAAVLVGAGLRPEPSDACWVLVKAPGLRDRLAPRGVVVRDCASFGLPDHVRIAVPDDHGHRRLEEALA